MPSRRAKGSRKPVSAVSSVVCPESGTLASTQMSSPAGAAEITALPSTFSVRSTMLRTITFRIWGLR